MNPHLRRELARAYQEEWLREAVQRRRARSVSRPRAVMLTLGRLRRRSASPAPALDPRAEIRIRPASPEEATVLGQLPTLRDAPVSPTTVLMAEVDGSTAAALSLDAGLIMSSANPPVPEVYELLRLRALQLVQSDPRGGAADDVRPPAPPRPGRRFTR